MKMGRVFLILIIISLMWIAKNHLDQSLGEITFRAMGLSPWSKGSQGLHVPNNIGIVLLLVSIIGAVSCYRQTYPKILSRIIVSIIVFIIAFPWVTENTMYLAHYNTKGVESIDVMPKDQHGYVQTNEEGDEVIAQSTFTLFNYGKATTITIMPVINDSAWHDVTFEPMHYIVKPRVIPMNSKLDVPREQGPRPQVPLASRSLRRNDPPALHQCRTIL